MSNEPIQCAFCGQFISYNNLENGRAHFNHEPSSNFGPEVCEWVCPKCDPRVENGKTYLNGRCDLIGPMDERVPGVFLDQYGRLYHPNGFQWDHAEGSTGNIDFKRTPHDIARAELAEKHRP